MTSRIIVVAGPGHTLNELTSRIINRLMFKKDIDMWQCYPGTLGLYLRHCDDYRIHRNKYLQTAYNDIREPNADSKFEKFIQVVNLANELKEFHDRKEMSFYFNTPDIRSIANIFKDNIKFTTILDLPNSKHRHHHLMMEYSTGAAESVDYSLDIDFKVLCRRLVKKHKSEQSLLNESKDYKIVNVNNLFNKDFSSITDQIPENMQTMQIENIQELMDEYMFINQCSNSMLKDINEMSWQEIVSNQ
jgi:hypothetical protein